MTKNTILQAIKKATKNLEIIDKKLLDGATVRTLDADLSELTNEDAIALTHLISNHCKHVATNNIKEITSQKQLHCQNRNKENNLLSSKTKQLLQDWGIYIRPVSPFLFSVDFSENKKRVLLTNYSGTLRIILTEDGTWNYYKSKNIFNNDDDNQDDKIPPFET